MTNFPTAQNLPAGAIPVQLVNTSGQFYNASGGGGGGGATAPYIATPLGFQPLTSLASATALTVPLGATFCYITVEGNGVRFRDDGTNPTASVGMLLGAGTGNFLYSGSLSAIRFIQVAASATLSVSYYK